MKSKKKAFTAVLLALVMTLSLGLIACKDAKQFTVAFESNGGSTVASVTVADGGKVTKPSDPTREDYSFGGWYKESACANEWKFDTDTVTADTTLYAKWTPVAEYTVIFDSNGGSAVADAKVKDGKKLTKPADPTLAKFRFDGWYKEEALTTPWNFETDTVSSGMTLYAKWTRIEAGEIAWVKPAAGSVVIAADIGLYNPDYRKTLEELAPAVYATEDGQRLPTIVAETDADFVYDETTHLLTPGSYTVTYETRDSMNASHEETFDVVVKPAEEMNYYVYAGGDLSSKNFGTGVGGARIRVAGEKYFEVTDAADLPEEIKNPHAEGKIADYEDPYIIKNATDAAISFTTSDAMAEYTVFEQSGKVVFGWNGANGRGIDENNRYAQGKEGGISGAVISVPAGGYMLIVGYTAGGNWYGKTTGGKAATADDYWGSGTDVPQYDMDGRQFASTSFNNRIGNMVQLMKGENAVTDEYVNQAPYFAKGFNGLDILRADVQLTADEIKTQVIAAVQFKDDNATFVISDDTVVAEANISMNAEDIAAIDTTVEAAYDLRIEVTDPTNNSIKSEFTIVVTVADKYLKIGDSVTWANPTVVKNAKLTSSPSDGKLYVWDSAAASADIHELKYTGCAVVDKNTGKIIASADWSNFYDHTGTKQTLKDGLNITTGDGKFSARQLFINYMTDEGRAAVKYDTVAKEDLILMVAVQGGTGEGGNHKAYGLKFNTVCDAGYAKAYVEIKGLTGLSNTVKPAVTE